MVCMETQSRHGSYQISVRTFSKDRPDRQTFCGVGVLNSVAVGWGRGDLSPFLMEWFCVSVNQATVVLLSVIFQSITQLPLLQNWRSWGQEIRCMSAIPVFRRLRRKDGGYRPVGLCTGTPSQKKKIIIKVTHWRKLKSIPAWSSACYREGSFVLFLIRISLLHATAPLFIPTPPPFLSALSLIFLGNMVYGLYQSK